MLFQHPAAQLQLQLLNKKVYPKFLLFFVIAVTGFFLAEIANAKILLPEAAGFYSQWSGSYADVDEYPSNDNDTTYNATAVENAMQSYNFPSSSDSGTIRGVRVVFYAKATSTDIEYVRPFLRMSSSDYFGDNCTTINNSSYTKCLYYWATRPSDGLSWSVADLTNLEAGFQTRVNGLWDNGQHRVSQLYIDVDFKSETQKTKFHIFQKLVAVSGALNEPFSFSIADPIDEVRSAFIEIKGVAQPVASVNIGVTVNNSAGTPGSYDATYNLNATGRPTSFKINHDVTDYFKSFVKQSGTYDRYIHLNPDNNIYLLNAKLVIVYTWIVPPAAAGQYRAKGEVTSATFETTGAVDGPAYNSILWKGVLNSGKVKFQIATSQCSNGAGDYPTCSTGSWNFIGGNNCDNSSWYEPSDQNVSVEITCAPSYHNGQRYFRYKIQLCSASNCIDSGNGHPEIQDVIVSWSP